MLYTRINLWVQGTAEIMCGGDGHAPKDGMALGMLFVLGFECAILEIPVTM